MDSQSFDYWMGQNNAYIPPPPPSHQSAIYDLPPDLSKVPSLSGSPVSSTYDQFPAQMPQEYYPQVPSEPMHFGSYQIPMTPPEFGSDHDTPSYCSPPPPLPQQLDQVYGQVAQSGAADRQHTTSGRRRAQNRAAQRAFRERKEKHARDLEIQLSALTERYNKLETSHSELNAAYEKLRKTIELLTQDDEDADGEVDDGKLTRRRSSNTDTLRKLLDILHGEYKSIAVKTESG